MQDRSAPSPDRRDPRQRLVHTRGILVVVAVVILGLSAVVLRMEEKNKAPGAASTELGGAAPLSASILSAGGASPHKALRLKVRVVRVEPHDPSGYTQGLVWNEGKLYESDGLYGSSSLREADPATGKVLRKVDVPQGFFAEGLALVGDRLIQLTWREGTAFVYSRKRFERTEELHYTGEGWGLAEAGKELVMSDGSDQLTFRDPATLKVLHSVKVRLNGAPVEDLNELEWVDGRVYANVWQTDEIVRIDPTTGDVEAVIDASGLLTPEEKTSAEVLNGIAYDPTERHFLITGKLWPKLFVVDFVNE